MVATRLFVSWFNSSFSSNSITTLSLIGMLRQISCNLRAGSVKLNAVSTKDSIFMVICISMLPSLA